MPQFTNHSFQDQCVLLRVDFNVPIKEGRITDDTRIQAALPTIQKILSDGGRVVLMSHWGRPIKDMAKKPTLGLQDFSLSRIVDHLSNLLGIKVQFAQDALQAKDQAKSLKAGEVLLLENLRFHPDRKSTRLNSSHVRISYA